MKEVNANIKIKNLRRVSGELIGSIIVTSSKLKPIIATKDIGKFIDELPILFIIAALTKGVSKFKNIGDLKHKESDRLIETKKILVQIGIKCKTTKDSMIIYGKNKIETKKKSIFSNSKNSLYSLVSLVPTKPIIGISSFESSFLSLTKLP